MTQDYKLAASWYKKSAQQTYTPAKIALGRIYHLGRGVPRNDLASYIWTAQAFLLDHRVDLADELSVVRASLTAAERDFVDKKYPGVVSSVSHE